MNLLIITQTVNSNDPVLGFFHQWIQNLSMHYKEVTVVCLNKGKHQLPKNVKVYSLGKEFGDGTRIKYIVRFYRYIWRFRRDYDKVFVHMNEEYVILGGLFWKLYGKPVTLWRNFRTGSFMTSTACHLANTVCYTSPSAYVVKFKNAVRMPIGIDTNIFVPKEPKLCSILFFGRLDAVKKVHVFIAALKILHRTDTIFFATICGDSTYPDNPYTKEIYIAAESLVKAGVLTMRPGIPHVQAPTMFAIHDVYVNITPSGSFDKTIGEAMASGCILVTANSAVNDVVPAELMTNSESSEGVAHSILKALTLSSKDRIALRARNRLYIEKNHSITLLIERLERLLSHL